MNTNLKKEYAVFSNGSTWLKLDCHLHTNADKEFKYSGEQNSYISEYVNQLKQNDIRIGFITNHNKFNLDEFKALRKVGLKQEIFLLPGIELSVNDGANGIHTLVVFSNDWLADGQDYINQFLNVAFQGKTPDQYEIENGRSQDNLVETIKKLENYHKDFFVIFAHVEDSGGLWNELDGGRLQELGKNEYFRRRALGFQKVRTHNTPGKKNREQVKSWLSDKKTGESFYPAELEGSDCKSIGDIGKTELYYLKISDFTFEAVKYALADFNNRVSKTKKKHNRSYIKSIEFNGGVLSHQIINFSSELNTLIGIRGSGKSSIIEALRYVLDYPLGEKSQDEDYKNKLIRHTLSSGGKVILKAIDRFGQEYEIRRILDEAPETYIDDKLQPGVTIKETVINKPIYFGQKDLSSSGEGFEKDLVEKLIGDKLLEMRRKIDEQKKQVQETVKRYLKISNIDDKLKNYEDKKKDAEHRLLKYKEYKIEEKLKVQIDFDTDSRRCVQIVSLVKEYIDSLNDVLTQYEDDIRNHVNYKSKQNEKFFKTFFEIYNKVIKSIDDLKNIIEGSKVSLTEIETKVKEFENIKSAFKEEFARVERELAASLKEAGLQAIKPDEFKLINKNLENAKAMIAELKKEQRKAGTIKNQLLSELSVLNNLWHEEFKVIETELQKVNDQHSSLTIRHEFKQGKKEFLQFMKENFKGSSIRETTYKKLVEDYTDFQNIFKSPEKAIEILGNSWNVFEEYFNKYLEIFLTYQTPNKFSIEYRGKELKDHSLGQRASALILFVLSQKENDVIIIDQPEDDLDNQTIYEDVIKLVRQLKTDTQFIFATHNPNIPVLGDADQIISCEYSNDKIQLKQGGIDDKVLQQEIVNIMEGGEEAFNKRKEIYKIWKPLNY